MKWNARDNNPPLRGRGVEILLNGQRADHVFALDTDEGWVDRYCTSIFHHPEGKTHVNETKTAPCEAPRIYGKVEFRLPDNVAEELREMKIILPNVVQEGA